MLSESTDPVVGVRGLLARRPGSGREEKDRNGAPIPRLQMPRGGEDPEFHGAAMAWGSDALDRPFSGVSSGHNRERGFHDGWGETPPRSGAGARQAGGARALKHAQSAPDLNMTDPGPAAGRGWAQRDQPVFSSSVGATGGFLPAAKGALPREYPHEEFPGPPQPQAAWGTPKAAWETLPGHGADNTKRFFQDQHRGPGVPLKHVGGKTTLPSLTKMGKGGKSRSPSKRSRSMPGQKVRRRPGVGQRAQKHLSQNSSAHHHSHHHHHYHIFMQAKKKEGGDVEWRQVESAQSPLDTALPA